ncbi:glycan biosynthesis hexose transferase WsfD [Oscillospiraceae bacterium LTW-04]|nr:hypothetical protein RBH76_09445 [Oscillospiraceae bacterium MB24-C1]
MQWTTQRKISYSLPSPAAAAVIVAGLILVFTLFIPPLVGMADNGDFYRVINGNGLYKLDRDTPDQFLSYFSSQYGMYQYFNDYEDSLVSSQTPIIHVAVALDRLLTGDDAVFDVRFLAFLIGLWALVALYLLVDYAAWGLEKRFGYIVAAIAVLIFFDTGYLAYFNSFYAEGLVLVSFLTAMTCALLIRQERYPPYVLLAVYVLSGVVLTCAKQQNAPLGILLGLLCIPMMRGVPQLGAEVTGRTKAVQRAITGICASLLCFCGVAVYILIPQEFVEINQYHAMTRGVLMSAENPEEALERFDIDPQYSLLDGSIYYERYPAVNVEGDALKEEFFPKYNFISVTVYYLMHPDDLFLMLDEAAKNAYAIRPDAIGNFERSAGREPGQKAAFFTLHSTLKNIIVPKTVGFVLIWLISMLSLSFRDRWRMLVLGCVMLSGFSQVGVSIIGAGDADLSKHIFLYNVAFDYVNFIIISTVFMSWRSNVYRKKHPDIKKEEAVCA